MAGWIYVMSNSSFQQGIVKIGKSERDPSIYRKKELETSGVPSAFCVEYKALVDDEHHEEGKRRHQRHLSHQDELSRAGRERRARDLVIKAKRQEYRSALKLVRDRERAIFAGR